MTQNLQAKSSSKLIPHDRASHLRQQFKFLSAESSLLHSTKWSYYHKLSSQRILRTSWLSKIIGTFLKFILHTYTMRDPHGIAKSWINLLFYEILFYHYLCNITFLMIILNLTSIFAYVITVLMTYLALILLNNIVLLHSS